MLYYEPEQSWRFWFNRARTVLVRLRASRARHVATLDLMAASDHIKRDLGLIDGP